MSGQCGAKTRKGTPCKQAALSNGRCYLHGGKTPAGAASPHFKTGRYSKSLPGRLKERYETARDDNELLALRDEIALIDARIEDVLKRVDTGESGAIWQMVQDGWGDMVSAVRTGDKAKQTTAANNLDHLIRQGVSDSLAWGEVIQLLDRRRRLVESERKRLVDLQQMITTERALDLITAVLAGLKESVSKHADKRTGNKILSDASAHIRRITTIDAG